MRAGWLGGFAAAALVFAAASGQTAHAGDVLPYDWTGFYVGVNAGSANGSYDPTTTFPQGANNYIFHPRDVNAVNAAGQQSIKPAGFIGGVQGGYNWQFGFAVAGVDAGLDYLNLNGAANSGAVRYPAGGSGFTNNSFRLNQFVISSYANADWLLTLRPRLGIAAGNWLFYGTGGLAVTRLHGQFLFTDGNAKGFVSGAAQESDINSLRAGYIVGGGVETAVTDHIRLRAEYDYLSFGTVYGQQTSTNLICCFNPPATQPSTVSMDLKANLVRVGLNYNFGDPNGASVGDPWSKPPAIFARAMPEPSNWEFDVGTRLWLSSGTVGAPNPLLDITPPPSLMNSRLTYENVDAWSGETFARIDHKTGFFVKGFLGGGGITRGTLVDEDFPGFGGAYSNTTSSLNGHIGYANIDVGYTFLRAPGAKVGAFVGYNYFTQHINGYGCNQVAGDTTCVGVDSNFQVFAEDERYDSLRVGLAAEFMLSEKWKFSADAAYLPRIKFTGQDDHNLRELLLLESANDGDGAMLEAILGYNVTPNWNVGVGGRYWAWNMRDGQVYFDFLGGAPTIPQYARYNSERYGVFVQSDYRWGDTTRPPQAAMASAESAPMNWTGVYVGGHLGGAIANNRWADPFGSTVSSGLVNVPGFGDTIHSTGPVGGAQAGIDWQTGHWLVGVTGNWSAADLRGENTCFSGIGGLNCQNIVKDVGTVAGRFGYAWDRALVYAKGGGAGARIEYTVLGATAGNSLGCGTTSVSAYGWMAGGGLEYALSENWSTMFDYEHIDLGTIGVNFPSVGLVNAQTIGIRQTIDLVKLGVNYRFAWGGFAARS